MPLCLRVENCCLFRGLLYSGIFPTRRHKGTEIHGGTYLCHMGIWKQLAEYLYIKKRDPNEPRTQWMKYMHGMNRISLIMFIIAVLIILFRLVILPLIRG